MTKKDRAAIDRILSHGAILGPDYVARALSALYRASNAKTQSEILALTPAPALRSAEFIKGA
jgi:hypothetical protein